jgi:Tol biopolymer transport system component
MAIGSRGRSLVVVDLASGRRRVAYRSPTIEVGLPVPLAWTPDGRWILFQNDEYGSASIAADGLPLLAVRADGGRARPLDKRVLFIPHDFVEPCGGGSFVVSAGLDRYVSADKRVDLVSPPSWRPRNLSRDESRSWYSGACAPNGRWVAATVTRNREEGRFDSAERSIWLLATDGSRRLLLVGMPGDGLSDEAPRWSRDGRSILYVEHGTRPQHRARLYLVDVSTGERHGPIAALDGGLGFYRYHDWPDIAAWYQPR